MSENGLARVGLSEQACSTSSRADSKPKVSHALKLLGRAIELVSSEWLLTRLSLPNGGTVIVLRSLFTAILICIFGLGIWNLLDTERSWQFSSEDLVRQIHDGLSWFSATFAAMYVALYARFASQWTYLANVYNQIKAAECRKETLSGPLAEWKAGFIEDAEELHLAGKPIFASVIHLWANDPNVKKQFEANTSNGTTRFAELMRRVDAVWLKDKP